MLSSDNRLSLQIRTFGGFSISYGDIVLPVLPSRASRSLCAYLFVNPQWHSRSRLAGLFWPDLSENKARRRLSQALWEIGAVFSASQGLQVLSREADLIGIDPALSFWLDVAAFEAALAASSAAPDNGQTSHYLAQAVGLYCGDFLPGFYEDWVLLEQERLRDQYLHVLWQLLNCRKRMGAYDDALATALTLAQADPLQEEAHQEVIRLFHLLGQTQEGLRHYEEFRQLLETELAVMPSPTTDTLARGLANHLAGQPAHLPEPPAAGLEQETELPLIGRRRERQALLRHLESALMGRGSVVLLEGEAGVGKSRLLSELVKEAQWRQLFILQGRTQEGTGMPPYAPLVDALAAELSPLRVQQLAALLDPLWLSVNSRLLPVLAESLPDLSKLAPLEPAQERIRLLEGLGRLILAWSQIAPILFIVEDLHWADEATFDTLAYLIGQLAQASVLVVASYRPEDVQARAHMKQGLSGMEGGGLLKRVRLGPLSQEETGELIGLLLHLPKPAPLFAQRIYRETGGNPLYVVEALRTLHAEGTLTRDADDNWTTPYDADTADYAELPLLPAVEQTIARRLARLEPLERQVLEMGSVLGNEISLPLLMKMAPLTSLDLLVALAKLLQQRFLTETATAYRFSHDVVRHTVYAAVPAHQRIAYHRQATDAILASVPNRIEALAHHYEGAQLWTKAAVYYYEAGRRAANVQAYISAVNYFNRAETVATQAGLADDFFYDLLAAREAVLDILGEHERQGADLTTLARLANTDSLRLIKVTRRRAWLCARRSDYDGAEKYAQRSLALAEKAADVRAQVEALIVQGQSFYWNSQRQQAVASFQQAITANRELADPKMEASALSGLASIFTEESEYVAAQEYAQAALVLCDKVGDSSGKAETLSTLGVIAMEQGDMEGASDYYRRALKESRAVGYRYAEARTLLNWGNVNLAQGEIDQALDKYQQAEQIFREIGNQRGMFIAQLNRGAAQVEFIGYDDELEEAIAGMLDPLAAQNDHMFSAQALAILGTSQRQRGDLAAARRYYWAALDEARKTGQHWCIAQAFQALAELEQMAGDLQAAFGHIESGMDISREFGFTEIETTLLSLLGDVYLALGECDAAIAASSEAVSRLNSQTAQSYRFLFRHYRALNAVGRREEGTAYLNLAHRDLLALLDKLAPAQREQSVSHIAEHRAILDAWAAQQPRCVEVRLPNAAAPLGRTLRDDELVTVIWTVETPGDREIRSKTRRRRQQILRLLQEAQVQGAVPAYHHLADALGVSERTIVRDMAELHTDQRELPPSRRHPSG